MKVFFVLGGPGAGKGTQCEKLAAEFGFKHFSAGDLLRAAAAADTEQGRMIQEIMKEGKIVPSEITVGLLKDGIESNPDAPGFLIDGFPRNMVQAELFESTICKPLKVLHFDAPEQVMTTRIMERSKSSGRADDTDEALLKRFATHREVCMPVVEHYRGLGLVEEIDATEDVDAVFDKVKKVVGAE